MGSGLRGTVAVSGLTVDGVLQPAVRCPMHGD